MTALGEQKESPGYSAPRSTRADPAISQEYESNRPPGRWTGLRARLMLLVLFATLMPVLLIGWVFYDHRSTEVARARRSLSAEAGYLALDLNDKLRATAQLLYGLSRARELEDPDRDACSAFLAAVLKEYLQFTGILTIKPDGQLDCDSLLTGRSLDLTDRGYFQTLSTSRKPLALEPVFGRLTGIGVMQVAFAARHETGSLRFVLLASLNLDQYVQAISRGLPFQSAVLVLVDDKGTILAHHPKRKNAVGVTLPAASVDRLVRAQTGGGTREAEDFDDTTRIWAVSALPVVPDPGLRILIGVLKADLTAAADWRLRQALAVTAIISVIVFAGAFLLAEHGIRRPVGKVVDIVNRISAGELSARIGVPHPRGEIGMLMAAVNRTARSLETARSLNQRIFETLIDAIVVVDQARRIVTFSAGAETIFGYKADEAIGQELTKLMPERSRSRHDAHMKRFAAGPQTSSLMGQRGQIFGMRKNGEEFPAEASISRFEMNGQLYFSAILRDISKAVATESMLRQAQEREAAERNAAAQAISRLNEELEQRVEQRTAELAAANKELEAFSYSVSHDLRAPLRAIDGFSRLLQTDHGTELADDAKHLLQVVRKNTQQMGRLIDDLLAFSRLNQLPLKKERIRLATLVRQALDELHQDREGRKLDVSVGELGFVRGDPALLRQAAVNLLSNALKFTRNRDLAKIEIGCTNGAETVDDRVFYVKDNGAGFDMRYADKLFTVFQRLHRADEYEGTGVGLAIVQRVIERHGGRVWAEAKLDEGATFYFTLGGGPRNDTAIA